MQRLLFAVSLYIFFAFLFANEASAQRTAVDRGFISISQVTSISSLPSGGMEIEGGRYLLNSLWSVGAMAIDRNQRVSISNGTSEEDYYDHLMWAIHGGWKYRFIHSYSRAFNLYIGARAYLGANHYEVFKSLPAELDGGFPTAEFIYGVQPELECEIFMGSRLALLLSAQIPVTFSAYYSPVLLFPAASFGLRLNL